MLKASEKKTLTNLLALAPEPEQTFTLDELMGFMFGLAMTPDMILPSEWLPIIFGGDTPVYDSLEQMKEMSECLIGVYNNLTDDFHKDKLKFPFDINKIKDKQLEKLYEWVSGFEEALILREELWDPEENPELSGKAKEELYHSMMTVQGLIDPIEVMDFFNNLPDEAFEEAFPGMQTDGVNRESLIQVFLMASLPLAVETFQNHARTLEKKRQQQLSPPSQLDQARSTKIGRNDPCPCNSGKKYKKCCGDLTHPKAAGASGGSAKKSNVIKVDFPQHGKKKQQTPAPIYQLKVGLEGAKPPIWRRIQVPGNTTLDDLHEIIQLCMGWTNSHLHMFIIDKTSYSIPHEDDDWIADNLQNESEFTLHALKNKIQPHFQYIYDFGDDWIHKVTVEKTLPPEEGKPYPLLITGRRACPPEDVGGIYGFMDMLKTLQNPKDEEYEELIEWLGDYFDPAEFHKDEKKAINEILKELYLQST